MRRPIPLRGTTHTPSLPFTSHPFPLLLSHPSLLLSKLLIRHTLLLFSPAPRFLLSFIRFLAILSYFPFACSTITSQCTSLFPLSFPFLSFLVIPSSPLFIFSMLFIISVLHLPLEFLSLFISYLFLAHKLFTKASIHLPSSTHSPLFFGNSSLSSKNCRLFSLSSFILTPVIHVSKYRLTIHINHINRT